MGFPEHRDSFWMGLPLRKLSLVALTVQFSCFTLLLRYSRVMPSDYGRRYLPSTALFLVELLKLALCLTVSLYQISVSLPSSTPATTLLGALSHVTFSGDSWKMAVPAGLYTLSNSLQYIGVSNLDAATYQVVYQLKIIFTAIFSVMMLRRTLNVTQWIALLLLMVGVAVVSIPGGENSALAPSHHSGAYLPGSAALGRQILGLLSPGTSLAKRSATYEGIVEDELALDGIPTDTTAGLSAVLGVCLTSGFAGVFFEKVIKEATKPPSLWIRNVQISLYSLFPTFFIGVVFLDGETVARNGFFDGYNWVVTLSVVVQAFGGILAAFAIYYADNISKNFALSISVILSSLAGFAFFDCRPSSSFLVGTVIVILATYTYSSARHPQGPPSPNAKSLNSEKITINAPEGQLDKVIVLPRTPLKAEEGLSTSRPGSPSHKKRKNDTLGYFAKSHD